MVDGSTDAPQILGENLKWRIYKWLKDFLYHFFEGLLIFMFNIEFIVCISIFSDAMAIVFNKVPLNCMFRASEVLHTNLCGKLFNASYIHSTFIYQLYEKGPLFSFYLKKYFYW